MDLGQLKDTVAKINNLALPPSIYRSTRFHNPAVLRKSFMKQAGVPLIVHTLFCAR
jgi:hypothetical protein